MQKVRSTLWVFLYMSIYLTLQFAYSITIGFAFGIREGIAGRADDIEESIESFLGTQITGAIIFAGITAFVIYYLIIKFRGKNFWEECRFIRISPSKTIASFGMGVSALAVSSMIMGIIALLMDSALLDHIENMNMIMGGNVWLAFIGIGIIAPIIEEIIFRGLIFRELEKVMSLNAVIVVQGLLFGLFHMNITQGAYASVLGIVLGLLLVWTRSIWTPIIVHLVNNSVSFGIAQLGESNTVMLVVGTLILLALIAFPFLIRYFYKSRELVEEGEVYPY